MKSVFYEHQQLRGTILPKDDAKWEAKRAPGKETWVRKERERVIGMPLDVH
jgi:hypothetical protein